MSDVFLGEITMFAGNFTPRDWALCNGQVLPITQNTALFSILGTQYGGNGTTTFALPNLTGLAPMHAGQGPGLTDRVLGQPVGSPATTVLRAQMPSHTHAAMANAVGDWTAMNVPTGNVWSATNDETAIYAAATNPVAMNPMALEVAGGSQPHNNMQPYLGLTFIIALQGIYPTRP